MKEFSQQTIQTFASEAGVGEILARLLLERGVDTAQKAGVFLHPKKEDFEDPFVLSGMQQAVDRIRYALDNKEKIVIYGDYDCDGITATSILYGYLLSLGADVSYYIPNRFDTGYGLTIETLEEIAETLFPDLIITVDCGISSVEEAEYLQEDLAIDLIVTDHHTLPDTLPGAIVVNPKLDPSTQSVDLCGAGVAFKVVHALGGITAAWKYVELAAVGTIADIVPLTKENRLITSLGLAKINSREEINKGLRLLIESLELKENPTATTIAFQVAPRINALGRLGDCSEVVRLFVSEEYLELQGLIEKMARINDMRKSLVNEIYSEAREMLKEYDLSMHKIILLYKPDWNPGVLGLVAGRLKGEFTRPVVLLCGDEEVKGSARSTESVDIYATIKSAAPLLTKFGGHKRAAGLTLPRENLIDARNLMDDFLDKNYPVEAFLRSERYDLELSADQITVRLADELQLLEPTGEGNPKPIFRFSSKEQQLLPFGNGQHLKGRISDQAEIIAFSLSHVFDALRAGVTYDYLCECSKNVYKNRERVQMRVVDLFARGFEGKDEDAGLFNRYLRSNLYKEEDCDFLSVSSSEAKDLLYDDNFCTLFVAFSSKQARILTEGLATGGKAMLAEFAKSLDAPCNEVLFAPETDPVGYRRIVLLDTPLTKGYVARLAKATNAEICVVKDAYPFQEIFRTVDLSDAAFKATYESIRRFVYSGSGAVSPMELAEKLAPDHLPDFLVRFYSLYESGSISIGTGFSIALRPFSDPGGSILYRRICALKKRL